MASFSKELLTLKEVAISSEEALTKFKEGVDELILKIEAYFNKAFNIIPRNFIYELKQNIFFYFQLTGNVPNRTLSLTQEVKNVKDDLQKKQHAIP